MKGFISNGYRVIDISVHHDDTAFFDKLKIFDGNFIPEKLSKSCQVKLRTLVSKNIWMFLPFLFEAQNGRIRILKIDKDVKNLFDWIYEPAKNTESKIFSYFIYFISDEIRLIPVLKIYILFSLFKDF